MLDTEFSHNSRKSEQKEPSCVLVQAPSFSNGASRAQQGQRPAQSHRYFGVWRTRQKTPAATHSSVSRQTHGATRIHILAGSQPLPECLSLSVSHTVDLLPSVSDVSLGLSVSVCFSLSSDVWLEAGSQPREGVGGADSGLVSPGRWSSLSSQPAFFEARTG